MRLLIVVLAAASAVSVAAVDHIALAMQADEEGNFEGAIRHFSTYAESNPDDPTGHNNLGVATMRYGIEMMMARRRVKGKQLFTTAAEEYRKALVLDKFNAMAGDNLRSVLHALESNFQMVPSADDKALLEDVGYPYEEFDSQNAVDENDPVHNRIKKKLGVQGGDSGPAPGGEDAGAGDGAGGGGRRLNRKYDEEEDDTRGGAGGRDGGGGQDDEEQGEEGEEEEEDPREAELRRIRALKNPYIKGVKLFEAGAIPEAVDFLCTQERIRIAPKAKEVAAGKPAFKTVARAAATLKVCGVVVVDRVIPAADAGALERRVAELMDSRMGSVDAASDASATFEGVEIAKRSEGRYEFANPLEPPFTAPSLLENAFVMPILRRSMGPRLEMDTFSTVVSEPGCPTQHWHADAGQLFPRAGMHLPAHGVVVFAAPSNVTRAMGPTEFAPGSHVQCGKAEKPRPVRYDDGSVVDLCKAAPDGRLLFADMGPGSVTLFDFRVFHRGGANTADRRRPLLYSTYLREWYTDKVNFHQQHSAAFDDLRPTQRKLLNRIDHKKHVEAVQGQVRQLGGTVSESKYAFHVYTYDSKDIAPPGPGAPKE